MANTANTAPNSAFNNTAGGSVAWTNPTNILTSNNSNATVTMGQGISSQFLVGNNFGFSIPTNATVDGVIVRIESSYATATPLTKTSYLWNGNSTTVDNKIGTAKSPAPAASESIISYGSSTDVWGATLNPTIVNSANFGFAQTYSGAIGSGSTMNVDNITIQIFYTVPPAAANCTIKNSTMLMGVGI